MMDNPRATPRMHDIASHLPLLEGLEVGLPPEQPYMERIPSPYFVNKDLPAILKLMPEPLSSKPPIPPYNPLRFSRARPNAPLTDDTAISPPLDSMSSEESLSRVPSLLQTRNAKTSKALRLLGQPTLIIKTPTYGETNKVLQLTGYDLASPTDRRQHRKSSVNSASTSSSFYSDPEIDLLSGRESNGFSGGYIGLHHSADMDQHHIPSKSHSPSSPGAQRRASKNHNRATLADLDDLLQRQCASFQHDTLSPTSSLVQSPDYSTGQSLYSIPATPPLPDKPHAAEFSLPLRVRPISSNDKPESRFSDASTPPASPTLRFVSGIRDSVLSITAHAPLGRTRPITRLLESPRDTNAEDTFFNGERSSGSGDDAFMSGGLQRVMGRKRDSACEAGGEGSAKRSRSGGLMSRISNAMSTTRSIRIPRSDWTRGTGLGIVISDHRWRADGPDTPMPGIENGKRWVESVMSKEASMRRRQSVKGAIGRASESRWVVGGEERRERRRERLKDRIRVIGLVEEDEEMAETKSW